MRPVTSATLADGYELESEDPVDGDPAQTLRHDELQRRLRDALDGLPLEQRDAFLLHEEGDLSVEQIAAVSGVGRETVKSRLRYAVQKLRAALGERPRGAPAPRFARASRWALPLALAATLVLSFVLVPQMDGRKGNTTSGADPAGSAVDRRAGPAPAEESAAPTPMARSTPAESGQPAVPSAATPGTTVESALDTRHPDETPRAWIARIERLQAAGELEAARRELAAIRERYPRIPLPERLRALGDR